MKYGKEHGGWKGGHIASHGYVIVYEKGRPSADKVGRIYEHRLVMEQHLGRFLKPGESVHHINRVRHDNRIENLRLFANHSEHIKFEFLCGQQKDNGHRYKKGDLPYVHKPQCKCFRCSRLGGNKFQKGIPPVPHKPGCQCFRCTKISPRKRHP